MNSSSSNLLSASSSSSQSSCNLLLPSRQKQNLDGEIKIKQPQLLSSEKLLNLAYGEKVVDAPKPLMAPPLALVYCEQEEENETEQNSDSNGKKKKKKGNKKEQQEQQIGEKNKTTMIVVPRIRTDSPLWFVPHFHPVEIVGLSADPETKKMFCTIKIQIPEGVEEDEDKDETSEGGENKIDEIDEGDLKRMTRMLIVPLDEMRRKYPQLVIDYFLSRSVYRPG